ncbi:hypothetical protein [Flavobacterium sp.]|uniref:hypothetical protein n=1 Tax=Flavobacterium sp. TaxID=239 RepID=UPI0025DB5625|nr:hypothetical protein [Flavobacterium sp.]
MRNFTLYLAVAACLVASKLSAQQSFETKVHAIADKIENITKEEKAALKVELEAVNKDLEAGTITKEQSDEKKMKLAEIHSKNIETRIGQAQDELKELVKQKVDGKIKDTKYKMAVKWNWNKNDSIKKSKGEARTTSQFVFAAGVNNLVTDKAVAHSDYRYWGSHFYEWGFTSNTRIFKNDNLLHLKYGFSVMYNNLRPTNNRVFVANGNQTNLETSSINLRDSRFRNVYVTAPVHLEFDFTKATKNAEGKTLFRTHEGVRFGIGGYAGFRVKSKQILKYEADGHDITLRERGGFNTNDFIYGVSTYLGYGETSLYLKYDLNPLFKDNVVKQNNISLGVRFDLN